MFLYNLRGILLKHHNKKMSSFDRLPVPPQTPQRIHHLPCSIFFFNFYQNLKYTLASTFRGLMVYSLLIAINPP